MGGFVAGECTVLVSETLPICKGGDEILVRKRGSQIKKEHLATLEMFTDSRIGGSSTKGPGLFDPEGSVTYRNGPPVQT
jgi:hypothetical protein